MTKGLALGIVLLSGVLAAQAKIPRELVPFQGTWTLTSVDGRNVAEAGITGDITITGANYVVTINGTVDERGTISIDGSKKPIAIDLLITEGPASSAGKRQLGIVEVGADTLKFHMAAPGHTTRPANFDPLPDHDVIVVTKKK